MMSPRKRLAGSKSVIFAVVTLLALPPAVSATPRKLNAHAATAPPAQLGLLFEVNSAGDGDNTGPVTGCDADAATAGDQCTLRAAIQAANANPGQHGIDIFIPASDPGCDPVTGRCVINLTRALPDLNTPIEINGPGADKLTVRRNTDDFYRIFNVTATGVVTLSGMTISNGYLERSNPGGGILNSFGGTVNVNDCAITDNVGSDSGGGIHNFNDGTVNVKDSLVARNSAMGAGGGCCSDAHGGGIANNSSGTINVINSTITGNSAVAANGGSSGSGGTAEGGGIFNSSGTVNITSSTLSGNSATSPANGEGRGGGIFNQSGIVNLKSTIVANNTAVTSGPDAAGGLTSHGFNLLEKTAGATVVQQTTDLFGVDPKLGPLQNNGGRTMTMSLLTGSPAIDKATGAGLTGPLSTDQRGTGFPRTIDDSLIPNAAGGDGTDIGAYEVQSAVQFSSAAYTVNEATAAITIVVKRTGSRELAATVRYTTSNGTAAAGKDYTAKSGTLSFAAGQASQSFTVAITNDTLDEADETVKLTLGSPTGGVSLGTPSTALLKIVDNDLPPTLSITNATVTEGNSGAAGAAFTVSLSAASGKTVTVRYATANGTAKAPGDYTARPLTTLTFSPGQTSKPIAIAVRGDLLDEADETFFVNLSSPVNAAFADAQGLGTITDDDPAPSITITDATVAEPDAGTGTIVFTVKMSAPSGQTVTVKFATANGTTNPAAAGTDYTAVALTTLTFLPGQITRTVAVQVKGDLAKESNETFFVNLSAATNATISDARGLGTIANDD
ncbi:MAG TPA: Calx-beta domain-containing protein [Pyrinomonadaceae bacterium]|nr:Calx-beta domain-containing protein [Pyrinomonadaceae bacterium]